MNHHISQQFNTELEELRNTLLAMGGLVEQQISDAIKSLVQSDSQLAEAVSKKDKTINTIEIAIDEECTRILARRQPAASDLRLVIVSSKTANDLERIGDEAAKIARLAIQLCEQGEPPKGYTEVVQIGNHVRQMVQDVLNSFARLDTEMALAIVKEDKAVDIEYSLANESITQHMMSNPTSIPRTMIVIWILRSLERIGDHARNIAEYVIYLVKGTDVRHLGATRIQKEVL